MKTLKCPSCARISCVDNNIVMCICPVCQVEMVKIVVKAEPEYRVEVFEK